MDSEFVSENNVGRKFPGLRNGRTKDDPDILADPGNTILLDSKHDFLEARINEVPPYPTLLIIGND